MLYQDAGLLGQSGSGSRTFRDELRDDGSPAIYIQVGLSDGMGLGVGNLGLPGYQVAVGFTRGSDAERSRLLSDKVIERLQGTWQVQEVPAGQGAKPLPNCDGQNPNGGR